MNQIRLEKHYFISYSRKDQDIARQIRRDLERYGFKIWMDEYNIIAGTKWEDEIRANIPQSSAVLYLVSPTSRTSPYVQHELELAKIYRRKIIPLWVQGDEWANVVAFGLFRTQYIDIRAEAYEAGINRLIHILNTLSDSEASFRRYLEEDDDESSLPEVENVGNLSPDNQKFPEEKDMLPEDTTRELQRNPYKGLRAFEYKDARDFFGRENLVSEMVQHIKNILSKESKDNQVPRCMMVVGASGSGKSSVVMAGLLPALEDKKNIPEVKRWLFLEPVRPGEDPMHALTQTLSLPFLNETKGSSSPLKRWHRTDLREKLEEADSRGLNELLREITRNPGERIVLLVDQFEEILAPAVNPERREQFISLLMAAATEPDTPILLLFTLRADFYDRILDHDALYKKVKRHLINIPPMTREELRSVIEKPVQRPNVNVTFDPYLAEDLLYEVLRRPESLPLLQFTLEQLFERRDREKRRLTRESYDEMGGLQGAINKHADYVYNFQLRTPQHRAEARKLFTEHFISISESYDEPSRLESGEEITRRRVTQADLHLRDLTIRSETINAFVDARLLTATSTVTQTTDLENITTYEISHEALINAWERLREWIKEDRKDIYLIQSLRPRIRQWDQEEDPRRKRELLVERLALQQLQEYRQRKALGPAAEEFLQASLAQQRRQKIQRYLLFVSIAALVIVSLIVSYMLAPLIRSVVSPDPTIVTSSAADVSPGTLAYALQNASDGATITFDAARLGRQTICLPGPFLAINKSVTIRGSASADATRVSSCTAGRYISIEPGHNVTIENLTLTSSYTLKHSIIENAGNLTINNSNISGNKSYNNGGAVLNHIGGILTLNGDTIGNNIVSVNGGAIYNIFGTVNINSSTISGNEAYNNGGGIYSQGGVLTVGGRSHISKNKADGNAGGGIDMVNGSLSMSDTRIDLNHSDSSGAGIGGGIAIVGSVAFITTSVITTNTASAKGGGMAVTDDTDNNSSSLVTLQGIIPTNNQTASYYIGQNPGSDIAGTVTSVGTNFQISDDPSIDNLGSPPPSSSPQKLPNYLGVVNVNTFCLGNGDSYGNISKNVDRNATNIMFTCFDQSNKPVSPDFSGQAICQFQYPPSPGDSVIDRMANYYDPTSLQCYKNLKRLGPIGRDGFARYCASQSQYTGLYDNSKERTTAYDWLCQPKDTSKLPSGLSVLNACNLQYSINNAVDRLANFNSADNGWECWEPA